MYIDLEITSLIDGRGQVICYGDPKVHWTLDERDIATPAQMNELKSKIEGAVQELLEEVNHQGGRFPDGLIH